MNAKKYYSSLTEYCEREIPAVKKFSAMMSFALFATLSKHGETGKFKYRENFPLSSDKTGILRRSRSKTAERAELSSGVSRRNAQSAAMSPDIPAKDSAGKKTAAAISAKIMKIAFFITILYSLIAAVVNRQFSEKANNPAPFRT